MSTSPSASSTARSATIGLAGYAVAVITRVYGQSFYLGIGVGVLAALAVSAALSFVFFRMNRTFFSIATWVVAEAAEKLFLNWKLVNMGGGLTVRIEPYPSAAQIHQMAFLICAISICVVYLVMKSKVGLSLNAIRDDLQAAASVGINLFRTRFIVYLIAAALCALAGSVFFINKGTIYPDSGFSVSWTVSVVFICIIGGTGTITGPIVGAVIYVILREFLAHYPGWSNIFLGLITIVMILFFPDGIVGFLQRKFGPRLFSVRRKAQTGLSADKNGTEDGSKC